MNEKLATVDGRSVLHIERRLVHRPETVWQAITDPHQLSQWFPSDVEMDFRVGGQVRFVFRNGEGPTQEGVIRELDPPNRFAFTWGDSLLRWEIRRGEAAGAVAEAGAVAVAAAVAAVAGASETAADGAADAAAVADGQGCVLVLTQIFDDRPSAASFAAGWQLCFEGLDCVLRGEPVDVSHDRWPALHEGYIHQFGLNEGVAEAGPDGWSVRFQRQLTRTADDVWDHLSGHGTVAVGAPVPPGFTIRSFSAGTITDVERPASLEYRWLADGSPAGQVRWELAAGNGGARLTLTQTGPSAMVDGCSDALAAWRARIEALAESLAELSWRPS